MNKFMIFGLFLATISILSMVSMVTADPTGPDAPIVPISSQRYPAWQAQTILALAGNVTQFNTNASSITRTWQGYFGNITGRIALGDGSNNTLYDWFLASPQGQIYAVRTATVPAWTTARCANMTELQDEDTALGVNESVDYDAVNNTFVLNGSSQQRTSFGGIIPHPTFWVSSSQVVANTCPVTMMYGSTGLPSANFREVVLSDGANVPVIYTAFSAHNFNPFADSTGFDGRTHDFEMLVGENGHGTDVSTSTYYFYLELS